MATDGDAHGGPRQGHGGDYLGGDERAFRGGRALCLLAGHGSAGLTGEPIPSVLCEAPVDVPPGGRARLAGRRTARTA